MRVYLISGPCGTNAELMTTILGKDVIRDGSIESGLFPAYEVANWEEDDGILLASYGILVDEESPSVERPSRRFLNTFF
jgi:hypothetical protein